MSPPLASAWRRLMERTRLRRGHPQASLHAVISEPSAERVCPSVRWERGEGRSLWPSVLVLALGPVPARFSLQNCGGPRGRISCILDMNCVEDRWISALVSGGFTGIDFFVTWTRPCSIT